MIVTSIADLFTYKIWQSFCLTKVCYEIISLQFKMCVKQNTVKYFTECVKHLGTEFSYKNQYNEINNKSMLYI